MQPGRILKRYSILRRVQDLGQLFRVGFDALVSANRLSFSIFFGRTPNALGDSGDDIKRSVFVPL